MLLTVRETGRIDRRGWPVTCGVPFADGEMAAEAIEAGQYRLLDAEGSEAPCEAEVAATWGSYPGGSNGFVKWLHLHFLADVPAGGERQYRLECGPGVMNGTRTGLTASDGPDAVTIVTGRGVGSLRLVISKRRFNILDEVWLDADGTGFRPDGRIVSPRELPNLTVAYDHRRARLQAGGQAGVNASPPDVQLERAGPVLAVVRVRARLDERFESVVRIFAYAGSPFVRIQETLIHGPTGQDRSAIRSQPVVMKSHVLELPVNVSAGEAVATVGVGEMLPEPCPPACRRAPRPASRSAKLSGGGQLVLEQDLHHRCDKDNLGPDRLSRAFAYEVLAGGEQVDSGRRAPGWIDLSDGRWGVTAAVRYFWQTFPKRLAAGAGGLRLEHWAEGAQLEPLERNFNWMGMAKTHDVWLYFHAGDAAAAGAEQAALGHLAEVFATCTPERYCASGAYGRQPLTPAVQDGRRAHPRHDELLSAGLNRERTIPDGFYHFREHEDGYGYFNFGDFLVGPYWGCQEYDPAYCMLQQFYRTGELKYLEFAAETSRHLYDILYSHTYTPETSNYPQRSHDKSGSHFEGEDSHGQRDMDTDPGHVFLAGLANYWFLTGDPRARDVIFWSLPVYLGDDWYRIGGTGTWRYLGGYLFTVLCYAYELTWDDRYLEPMIWAARQYMVNDWGRHGDGIWWSRHEDGYACSPWLADSITNGYTQLLKVYPGCPYRRQVSSAIVNLADFLIDHGFAGDLDGLIAHLYKPSRESTAYESIGGIYRKGMGNMAVLTLARAYRLTGNAERYLPLIRAIQQRVLEHVGDLSSLKGVCQSTYYAPMVLPYLEGAIPPRPAGEIDVVEPVCNWAENLPRLEAACRAAGETLYLGDELAAACAPEGRRGRAFGNHPGWRLADAVGAIDGLLSRHQPRYAVVLAGGSDLPSGHPERTDFEANYTLLVRRILSAGSIPILATLPPCSHLGPFAWLVNATIYQAARLHRLPLIDLDELMRAAAPPPVIDEPAQTKTPPPEWVQQNAFAPGHEAVLSAELARIVPAAR